MIEIKNREDFEKAEWPMEMREKVIKWWEERWCQSVKDGMIIFVFFSEEEIDNANFPREKILELKKELQLEREYVMKHGGVVAVVFEKELLEREQRLAMARALLGLRGAQYNSHGDLRATGPFEEHWSH
ncbi:MAG: hypothetical protein WC663_03345 [Patescibacteria group bacterium]|jgi:hypothetical protein